MTGWMWVLTAGLAVIIAATFFHAGRSWGFRHGEERANLIIGVIAVMAAAGSIAFMTHVAVAAERGDACDRATLKVLKDRSNARDRVDDSTRRAQAALAELLHDWQHREDNPANIDAARKAFTVASQDRADLANVLSESYPTC